ncbi:carbohydrate-binding protein [Pontiellaceae bacterium B12219]|nr:carbohydrate-binding protein [Pontiellaceae bacterium B12219]
MKSIVKNIIGAAVILTFFCTVAVADRTFVHPGITTTRSDLDRIKYMVEARIDPWYSSYQEMAADSKSSYDYTVRGDPGFTVLGRDDGTNYKEWNDDIRAAYYNAIRWYVTGDSRHAEKSIEIFNAWTNLTSVTSGGTRALSGGIGYIMIEAAEIIKSTYSGWSESEIQAFKDMLVYPGYSTTAEPAGISRLYGSFYWQAYQGDPVRHGNQGLAGFRTVMAMGIFMDNEIMYDRALLYIQGLPHRPDDLPYPSGPSTATTLAAEGDYADTYNYTTGSAIEDFGFNEVMTNYIWETGQCQESSRDQSHSNFGLGILCAMSEMAWNQGDDLYSHENDRLLLGLEYTTKYNVSYLQSYPDQTTWWIPTVESGEFMQGFNASQRVYSKAISPINIGGFSGDQPIFETPVGHYLGRGFKTEDEVKWTVRARDYALEATGYENAGHVNGAIGWGALTERRPDYCYGDPISGIESNVPNFAMHQFPGTLEAELYDYSPVSGEGRTFHDKSVGNAGGVFRTDGDVDIAVCSEGGYALTDLEDGEWVSYTVNVAEAGKYSIKIRYAGTAAGAIRFSFNGQDVTGNVILPTTGNSTNWVTYPVAENIYLQQGVQSMRIYISGTSGACELNNITLVQEGTADPVTRIQAEDFLTQSGVETETTTDTGEGQNIGHISDGDWCRYGNYTLDDTAAIRFRFARPGNRSPGRIEVRLDHSSGTLIGSFDMPVTGGWQIWDTFEIDLLPTAGSHALVLVFVRDEASTQTGDLCNLNWFELILTEDLLVAPPTGLSADPINASQIDLSWDPASGVSEYHLKRGTVSGGPYILMVNGPAATHFTDSGLQAGINYYYVVSTVSNGTESDDSAEVQAVPSAPLNEGDVLIAEGGIVPDGSGIQNFSISIASSGLGHNYQVWTNSSLDDSTWYMASDIYSGTGGELQIDVPVNSAQTNCFYKLEAWRQ